MVAATRWPASPARTVEGINVPSFRAIAGRPNQTPQRLQSFIMAPHRPMPGTPMSLAEVDDVVALPAFSQVRGQASVMIEKSAPSRWAMRRIAVGH